MREEDVRVQKEEEEDKRWRGVRRKKMMKDSEG